MEDRVIRDWLGAIKYAGLIVIEYILMYLKWANGEELEVQINGH